MVYGDVRITVRLPVLYIALLLVTLMAGCQKPAEKAPPKSSDKSAAIAPTAPPAPTTSAAPIDLLCGGASGRACQLGMLGTEPEDGVTPLLRALNEARASIDYVPFELDDKRIVAALSDAQRRGVRVRVLLEPVPGGDIGTSYSAMVALVKAGIESRDANPAYSLTHAKYAVIDGERTLLLTYNSTAQDIATKRDFAIVDDDPADARFVQSFFNADWARSPVDSVPPGFVVSPENSNSSLVRLVDSATRTLDVYAEKLLPSPLMDAILNATKRGVSVRILAAPSSDTRATRERILQAVRSGQLQVHIPRSPRVHAKVLLVDGATLFLGSENVQDAPRERRRELGMIFEEPTIAERIQATFERDWASTFDPLE
jgi:phosphatidylserine/phosphatidylglycerophosphate/cardiolipin synthase-like enzyme